MLEPSFPREDERERKAGRDVRGQPLTRPRVAPSQLILPRRQRLPLSPRRPPACAPLPAAATAATLVSSDWRVNFVLALSSRKGCRTEEGEEKEEEDATESGSKRMREWVGALNALPQEKLRRLQPTPGGKGQRHPGSRRLPPTASDRAARECTARSLADTSVYLRLCAWKSSPKSPPHNEGNRIRPRQAMNGGREAAQSYSPVRALGSS